MSLPPAIIFINFDAVDGYADGYDSTTVDGYVRTSLDGYTKATLMSQLFINEFMTAATFKNNVAADANYISSIHLQSKRILVSWDFLDHNRDQADIVLYYSHGMIKVYKSKNGPPGLTLPIDRINIYTLLRDVGSAYVVILPATATKPPCSCTLGGIVVEQMHHSNIYCPNTNNESHNLDWINRK